MMGSSRDISEEGGGVRKPEPEAEEAGEDYVNQDEQSDPAANSGMLAPAASDPDWQKFQNRRDALYQAVQLRGGAVASVEEVIGDAKRIATFIESGE
jgi:hypothetical protein